MKKKMNLATEIDLTQDSVVQLTCWCGQIALHELWGLGRVRLDRITRRQEQLGNESLAVVMVPDRNGMPQTEKARQLRAEALPEGVPVEFRVPAMRTPRTRREQQLKIVGDRAATMAWQLMALACVQELGFGAERLNRLYREMRHNYEQLNEWGKADGIEVAMEKLRRWRMERVEVGPLSAQLPQRGNGDDCHQRRGPNRRPEEKPELCKPCKIPNPTPLQLDVHDLCLYNRKARKQGKPELSYGGWAAKGKPGRP